MEPEVQQSPTKRPGRPDSARRLNALAAGMPRCSTYLEIGVAFGRTLMDVEVAQRWGVDPGPRFSPETLPDGLTFANVTSDAFFASLDPEQTFDLVFLDPPYAQAQAMLSRLEELLPGLLAPGGRIVLECDRRDPPALDHPMVHERRYGDTVIRIHSSRE